jgi:hypothetical protein
MFLGVYVFVLVLSVCTLSPNWGACAGSPNRKLLAHLTTSIWDELMEIALIHLRKKSQLERHKIIFLEVCPAPILSYVRHCCVGVEMTWGNISEKRIHSRMEV